MKLSLLILATFIQNIQTDISQKVLDKFKTELNVKTLIVFASNATDKVWQEAGNTKLWPKVVITDETYPQLKLFWGTNLVSFIYVDYITESHLEDIVKPSLINIHLRDILFYTNSSLNSPSAWHWLFEWCWLQGFWRVLLLNNKQQYLTMDTIPAMEIKAITLSAYLEKRHHRITNLQGFPVRVAVGNNPPRAHASINSLGQLELGGAFGHAVKIFAAQFNATLDFVIMPNMASYSVLSCIEYLKQQKTDVCADSIPPLGGIITTRSQSLFYGRLLVPYDTPLPTYQYFLKPYPMEVWCVIFVAFFFMVMILCYLEFEEHHHIELSRHLLTAFQSFIYISFRVKYIRPTYRIFLESLLLFCGFALSSCYLAVLSSILLTKIYHSDILSLNDVIERHLPILASKYDAVNWNTFGAPEEIKPLALVVNDSTLIQYRRSLNATYILWAVGDKVDFYLYQQKYMLKPRMKKLGNEVVIAILGGVPMRSYWPYQDLLENFMDNLFSSGLLPHLQVKAYQEGIAYGHIQFFPTDLMAVEPLNMEYFQVCTIVLAAGYGMALLCFIIEIVNYKKSKK